MKKKIVIISMVVLLAVVGGYFKFRSQATNPAGAGVWVTVSKVEVASVPLEARALGTLTAQSVSITPEVAGHVQKVLFTDGTFVSEKQPLIQLDDDVYKTKYELSKAKLQYSATNLKRMELLGTKGAVAKQAIDEANADFKEKKADTKESAVLLSKMLLTAPFSGVVGKSSVTQGDYVTIGQSLVTLTDTKHLHIEYSIPEKYIAALKLGQTVKISAGAYPEEKFSGKVAFISPTINPENRSISIYADIENNDNRLAPGMFVNVKHLLQVEKKVLLVPARSLVPVLDGAQIYKVMDGKAYAVNVVVGLRFKDSVEITQGLNPGDLIITDGQFKVKNGTPINYKKITG